MLTNMEVINRFIQGRNAKNRHLSSRNGAIYTYKLKMGWKENGHFVTIREAPSVTSIRHLSYLVNALYRRNLYPKYFEDKCEWVDKHRNYDISIKVGPYTIEVYRYPIKKYERAYIRRKGTSIRSPSLLKYLGEDDEVLEKKAGAIFKRFKTTLQTEKGYDEILEDQLYQKLRFISAGNYGGLEIVDGLHERVITYGDCTMRLPWIRGINKNTVKAAKDLLNAVPEEVKILIALE